MKQFTFIKHLRTAIAIAILLVAVVIFNGCNDSSTSNTEVKDSATSTISDTSHMMSTDTVPQFDSLQRRSDTSRSDQTPPPPR